ncbi:MAG: anaerobic selenocysteine-containing dehydrogenase [Myxococcota bacterium]|jgi:anaerobic selenocysteine-containing dehydrogenase
MAQPSASTHQTACILCSINCGLELTTEGRRITRVKGDKAHPASKGYLCEKASRLDWYQNGRDRLTSPMRRRSDGTYEAIDWDTAITEVASRLAAVRDAHGGSSIFYYGGGAQGNHLGGGYGRTTRGVLGSRFSSNALAQEKTGEFWVDGKLYGRARCHTCPDFENAEVAVLVGKNPWQSHGFPRARKVLRDIAKDPARSMIVIDPRRTETAEMADIHLQVRPGGDAWLLAALIKMMLDEGLVDSAFLKDHTSGLDDLKAALADVDVSAYCERAGVEESDVRRAATRISEAASVSVLEDLGIQQAPNSTLCSWLEKLMYIVTGNFAKPGAMNIHSRFAGLGGGAGAARNGSPVGGHQIIAGLIPCNVIPDEILTDHPDRFRAMIIESGNPVHSLADSPRMREAMRALDLVVVIDVAMTETAREADYVLPASSQYEKWECTFFNLEFPHNVFHLRPPIFEPLEGTLPEAEIHARIAEELGALEPVDLDALRAAAEEGLEAYGMAFMMAAGKVPGFMKLAPVVLYRTLGPALPEGAEVTAAVWGLAQTCAMKYGPSVRRAGFEGPTPLHLGNNLFRKILDSPSGVVFSEDPYEETWARVETPDKRIRLVVPELLPDLKALENTAPTGPADLPLVLAAGERRSNTANTLYRDPNWRKKDPEGSLRISEADAQSLGLNTGDQARLVTKRGEAIVTLEVTDTMRAGHISLPNGQGLSYPKEDGTNTVTGVAPNELTSSADRDRVAGTPWHKHVRARLEKLA